MKKWIFSLVSTVIILGAGAYSFFYMKDAIPKELQAASTLIETPEEPKEEKNQELKEIIHHTQKLVVKIETPTGSLGSGFLYNDKGDIVTNAHVVANATEVTVSTSDSKQFNGTVIGISNETDVAVVRVPGLAGTEPLPIARERKGEVGDEVLALGSPLGLQNTVTTGIISGVDRDFEIEPFQYEDAYQISAPIAPGNSGGPLIDRKTGEVLGINSAGTDQGSIGFSLPIISVISLIDGWSNSPMTSIPAVQMGTDETGYTEEYSDVDYAGYLVEYFYENLNYGDYVTAYALLGSSWQTNTSYQQFREGYLNTLAVTIDDLSAVKKGSTTTVVAVISAEERTADGTVYSKYQVTYEIGYENDQLKILSGSGKKIN